MEMWVVWEDVVDYQGDGLVIAMKIEGVKGRQSWRQGERERERERGQGSPLVFTRTTSGGSDLISLPISLESSSYTCSHHTNFYVLYAQLLEA